MRYLANYTRQNIAFALSRLAKSAHQPTYHHIQLLMLMIRYLDGTKDHGIHYVSHQSAAPLKTYSDLDSANYEKTESKVAIHVAFGAPFDSKSKQKKLFPFLRMI